MLRSCSTFLVVFALVGRMALPVAHLHAGCALDDLQDHSSRPHFHLPREHLPHGHAHDGAGHHEHSHPHPHPHVGDQHRCGDRCLTGHESLALDANCGLNCSCCDHDHSAIPLGCDVESIANSKVRMLATDLDMLRRFLDHGATASSVKSRECAVGVIPPRGGWPPLYLSLRALLI